MIGLSSQVQHEPINQDICKRSPGRFGSAKEMVAQSDYLGMPSVQRVLQHRNSNLVNIAGRQNARCRSWVTFFYVSSFTPESGLFSFFIWVCPNLGCPSPLPTPKDKNPPVLLIIWGITILVLFSSKLAPSEIPQNVHLLLKRLKW